MRSIISSSAAIFFTSKPNHCCLNIITLDAVKLIYMKTELFHPSRAHFVRSEFKRHFGLDFQLYWDKLWLLLPVPSIRVDILNLDQHLMSTYKYTGSMSDFVMQKFGAEAHSFLKKLL